MSHLLSFFYLLLKEQGVLKSTKTNMAAKVIFNDLLTVLNEKAVHCRVDHLAESAPFHRGNGLTFFLLECEVRERPALFSP